MNSHYKQKCDGNNDTMFHVRLNVCGVYSDEGYSAVAQNTGSQHVAGEILLSSLMTPEKFKLASNIYFEDPAGHINSTSSQPL